MASPFRCLVKACKNKTHAARGLCRGHYSMAKRAVKAGKTSWEKLEARRLAEVRRAANPFVAL